MTKEELRMKNTLLEYNHEIKYCKEVLATKGISAANRTIAEQRLKSAEEGKKNLLTMINACNDKKENKKVRKHCGGYQPLPILKKNEGTTLKRKKD